MSAVNPYLEHYASLNTLQPNKPKPRAVKIKQPRPDYTVRQQVLDALYDQPEYIIDIIAQYANVKKCYHTCELTHVTHCCICSDQRPYYKIKQSSNQHIQYNNVHNKRIEFVKQFLYLDGRQYKKIIHNRSMFYCKLCKEQFMNVTINGDNIDTLKAQQEANYILKYKSPQNSNNNNTNDATADYIDDNIVRDNITSDYFKAVLQ